MSCAECESAEQNQRASRIKRWLGLAFVGVVVAFIVREQLSAEQSGSAPTQQKPAH